MIKPDTTTLLHLTLQFTNSKQWNPCLLWFASRGSIMLATLSTMSVNQEKIRPDQDRLRDLVHQTLCDIGQLESSQFPLTERPLTQGGNPCGVLFSVNGPRQVRLTAVWDAMKNTLFVYDSTGSRCDQLSVDGLTAASA
ncbi:MAG: hypothetical protein CMJ82_02535 [Planctomycetaceae bacterium]|nr:hypothetical protein [Planctomycetaceae bacterium]